MKNKTKQNNKQPTKITKNRITSLFLAFLLVTTVLSPTIPVKAQETTVGSVDATENNTDRPSGGHEVEGDGDSSQRPTHDPDLTPTITINDDGTRTLKLKQKIIGFDKEGSVYFESNYSFEIVGKGKYTIITFVENRGNVSENGGHFQSYILSNESFSCVLLRNSKPNYRDVSSYKGVYYSMLMGLEYAPCASVSMYNFPNKKLMSNPGTATFENELKRLIDSGELDLSKDDYMPEDEIANMKPVRDPSIGYLPRVRYFDDRKNNSSLNTVTSTIQWDSFVEPYSTDLENPYYVEIYADLNLALVDSVTLKTIYLNGRHHYKKYGELKYVHERLEFSYSNPFEDYLSSTGSKYNNNNILYSKTYVVAYYVRLVHYDYEKQQVLCGGFTKITPNENGGCTTETGDFPDDNPNDDDDFVSDGDDPDEWDDTGWEPNPNPDDPDNPDFGIDTSSIGAFIVSAITSFLNAFKSILSLVGEFPELCRHVFSFLPEEISTLMFGGVAAIIIMRFLGR